MLFFVKVIIRVMTESSVFLDYLVPGITFGLAAAAQPGPLMLYLISRTLRAGWKRTLAGIFAPLVSDGPIAVICLLVLGALPPDLLHYIRIAGGLFILWLAFGAAKAWKKRKTGNPEFTEPGSQGKTILDATVVNILNPGPWIGWSLIVGPMFIEGWRQAPGYGISLLSGFYGTMFLISGLIIYSVDKARERVPRLQRLFLGLSALFLAGIGIYQLARGLFNVLR